MQVPLLDLKGQFVEIRDEIAASLEAVFENQQFIGGPAVAELEKLIAHYSDCTAAVGVSSGTDALLASLMALGIGSGDEVITSPFTFFATAGSIWRAGAMPVFVDIRPDTFNIDVSRIEAAVTLRTKAILPVHLFGQMAEMDPIMEIARKRKLHVVEDAAQAIGATYKGHKAGSVGVLGCFSFFPSKNLGAMGDGGMIVARDRELAERLGAIRNHGSLQRYYHKWVGGNFRLDAIQAAALIVKLRHLERWSARRRVNADRYNELFEGIQAVTTPAVLPGNVSVFNQYVIRVPQRDALKNHLKEQGIGTEVYYPQGLHEQECFASLRYKRGDFPETERATGEVLALPIYPELTDEQIRYVADKVKQFFAGSGV